jgi:hypothetical protein
MGHYLAEWMETFGHGAVEYHQCDSSVPDEKNKIDVISVGKLKPGKKLDVLTKQ